MRGFQRRHLWLPLFFWMAVTPLALNAQSPVVITSEDQTLVINGTLGANAPGYTRHLTLTLKGGESDEAKQVQVRRSDLVRQGEPGVIVDRANVVVSSVTLKRGQPQDVAVTVNNITRSGIYEGKIKFWLPEQNEENALVINLSLRVAPKIDVKPPTIVAVQVARCGMFPCSWSGWLPQNLVGNKRGLLLDNQTQDRVAVVSKDFILLGERTGLRVAGTYLIPSIADNSLPASRSVPVDLEIPSRDALPPDHYVGTLRLGLAGAENPAGAETQISVPITLDVREAPWLPLALLLLGVIAGRLVKNMSTPEAVLQVKLLKRLNPIQSAVGALDERDREALQGRIEDLRARIESATETEQALTQELDKIEASARLLGRLSKLKQKAMELSNATLKAEILGKIDLAATAVLKDQASECERLIAEIVISLRQAAENVTDGTMADAKLGSVLDSAREASVATTDARNAFEAEAPRQPGRNERLLGWLAGANLMSAGARFWVWRPILFLLLLLLLTMLGLKSLYINDGINFGVGGIYDYLGLFLWGMSADILQRTLQTLRPAGS